MRPQRVLAMCFCAIALIAFPATTFADTNFAQLLTQLEQQYQLPSGILWKIALAENAGKATGCAPTSSACGMFQFTLSTWEADTRALHNGQPEDPSLRSDPTESAKAAAFELATIRSQIGGLITQTNVSLPAGLYLGYFLGSGGAKVLLNAYLQNPGQSACALIPPACNANKSVMASRSVADMINWAAQKMSASGVPNVPGDFECANGTSYAYSSCNVSASNFLPANTVTPANPLGQYATVFPSATNSSPSPVLTNAPAQSSLPLSYSTAGSPGVTVSSTATSGSQCTPQYSCINNAVYYESSSCSTSVFQQCQYGCSGTACAPNPSSASSVLQPLSASNIVSEFTSATASTSNVLGTVFEQLFSTSTSIGTTTSLTSSSSMFSFVSEGDAISLTTGATTSIDGGEAQGFGQPTFASSTYSYSQNVYVPARVSPFTQILNQLENVLHGLLSYLQTI
jgi:hypothetical protein